MTERSVLARGTCGTAVALRAAAGRARAAAARSRGLDLHWEHHPSHFWLVLGTAVVSSVLAYATGAAAVRRGDARVLFVSLAFLSSAGFLGAARAGDTRRAARRAQRRASWSPRRSGSPSARCSPPGRPRTSPVTGPWRRSGSVGGCGSCCSALMALWAVLSLGRAAAAGRVTSPRRRAAARRCSRCRRSCSTATPPWRYLVLWRRRRAPMLVAMMAAFVLLAEAMVAIAFARNWHLSWWEWHVLMLAAFALVAVGARRPGTRSGSPTCTCTTRCRATAT